MKVAVYTIALNEAKHVERWLSTAREADLVMVADTGSTDGTVELLRAGGAVVEPISIKPWRFDDARTAALSLLPTDVDVCVSLDLDEVLSPGWRAVLGAEWGDANQGDCFYAFNHHPDGTPDKVFRRDHIHARFGYRWVHPVHERLVPDRVEQRLVHLSFEIHQWADATKSRGQYLPLLFVAAREHPRDPQTGFWLARELMFYDYFEDAIREFERYLGLAAATWEMERAAAMRYLGLCHQRMGRTDAARSWYERATHECPEAREVWVDYAQFCHDTADWPMCHYAARRAMAITNRPDVYLTDPRAWAEGPFDLGGIAAWHLGRQDEALAWTQEAHRLAPHDARIAGNVTWITDHSASG